MRNLILAVIFAATLLLVAASQRGSAEDKVSKASVVAKRESVVGPSAVSSAPASNVSTAAGPASEWVVVRQSLVKTKVSLAAAVKIAQDKIGAGRVVEAYFKVEDSRPLYAVEIIPPDDKHQEVVIDALSGNIVELGAPDPEDKFELEIEAAVAKFTVTIPEAIETASQNMPHARPFDIHAEKPNDAIVLTVELLDGAEVRRVRIDPTSGAVLSIDPKKE